MANLRLRSSLAVLHAFSPAGTLVLDFQISSENFTKRCPFALQKSYSLGLIKFLDISRTLKSSFEFLGYFLKISIA